MSPCYYLIRIKYAMNDEDFGFPWPSLILRNNDDRRLGMVPPVSTCWRPYYNHSFFDQTNLEIAVGVYPLPEMVST